MADVARGPLIVPRPAPRAPRQNTGEPNLLPRLLSSQKLPFINECVARPRPRLVTQDTHAHNMLPRLLSSEKLPFTNDPAAQARPRLRVVTQDKVHLNQLTTPFSATVSKPFSPADYSPRPALRIVRQQIDSTNLLPSLLSSQQLPFRTDVLQRQRRALAALQVQPHNLLLADSKNIDSIAQSLVITPRAAVAQVTKNITAASQALVISPAAANVNRNIAASAGALLIQSFAATGAVSRNVATVPQALRFYSLHAVKTVGFVPLDYWLVRASPPNYIVR